MKKKVLCTALVVTILLTQTASVAPLQWHRNELIYDTEIGFFGNVTLTFASDGGSFIRPITRRYGESINLESYVPTKYGYTFKGWFTDTRTKQNQATTFKFTKPDVLYAKWEKNPEEPINPNDEIMAKDTCYLTEEETKIRNEIIQEKNKAYIEGFGLKELMKQSLIWTLGKSFAEFVKANAEEILWMELISTAVFCIVQIVNKSFTLSEVKH